MLAIAGLTYRKIDPIADVAFAYENYLAACVASFGSDARGDDTITSYSSRGPTRSFWTDDNGAQHYDNLLKPDLIAPGNKIVGAAAANNLLLANHPELDANVSSLNSQRMMYLSGSSMAAPVTRTSLVSVSG